MKKKDILNTMINQIHLSNFDLYCELYLHNNLLYFIFHYFIKKKIMNWPF